MTSLNPSPIAATSGTANTKFRRACRAARLRIAFAVAGLSVLVGCAAAPVAAVVAPIVPAPVPVPQAAPAQAVGYQQHHNQGLIVDVPDGWRVQQDGASFAIKSATGHVMVNFLAMPASETARWLAGEKKVLAKTCKRKKYGQAEAAVLHGARWTRQPLQCTVDATPLYAEIFTVALPDNRGAAAWIWADDELTEAEAKQAFAIVYGVQFARVGGIQSAQH